MSVRTCLLCGKPLSRIWSGSNEEFCSREHRNQYRLRRGMDRLLESTRVSNVMRRRELPMPVAQPVAGAMSARLAGQRGIRIQVRPPRPQLPAASARLHAGIPPNVECVDAIPPADGAASPREFRMLRQRQTRPVLMRRRPQPVSDQGPPTKSKPFGPAPKRGRALRVSLSAGFHLPKVQRRQFAAHTIAPPALRWNKSTHQLQSRQPALEIRVFGVAVSTQPMRQLGSRDAVTVNFRWPGLRPNAVPAFPGRPERRASAMMVPGDDRPPVTGSYQSQIHSAGLSASFLRVLQRPNPNFVPARIATVRFDSQYLSTSMYSQEYSSQ